MTTYYPDDTGTSEFLRNQGCGMPCSGSGMAMKATGSLNTLGLTSVVCMAALAFQGGIVA